MPPRRVAYVLNVFPKLSETFIAEELAELRRRGVELRILSLQKPAAGPHHDVVARAGLTERTCYDLEAFGALLPEFRPELLHAHFAREATTAARDLASELGVPFTFTAHGYDIYRKPPPDFAERAAAANAMVTVSAANACHIAKTFGVPRERIHVIPCGVDTQRFRPSTWHRERNLIVCVARLVAVKNLGLLLEACALLRACEVGVRCVIVGDGPEREALLAYRARLGLDGVVELVGAAEQEEVLRWWHRAAVGVLTSHSEGMPVSLMEAAACGVPAAATAVGGVPELVENGVTGLLAPAGDAAAVANAIAQLLRDKELGARMGAAARRRAEAHFSITRQVDRLLGLWAEVLNGECVACP